MLPHPGGFSFKNMRNDTIILPAMASIWCQLERPNHKKKKSEVWIIPVKMPKITNKNVTNWVLLDIFSHLSARQAKGQGVAASKEDNCGDEVIRLKVIGQMVLLMFQKSRVKTS